MEVEEFKVVLHTKVEEFGKQIKVWEENNTFNIQEFLATSPPEDIWWEQFELFLELQREQKNSLGEN